ncbi:MAG: LytR/AlgR family response regulator transcription factor [Bacteroidales bacterium]
MKQKLRISYDLPSKEQILFLGIGFGLALFILIFQPFPFEHLDFDSRIIVGASWGMITYALLVAVRVIIPCYMPISHTPGKKKPSFLWPGNLILFFSYFVTLLLFLYLAASVKPNFLIAFKASIISLIPSVSLSFFDKLRKFKSLSKQLQSENRRLHEILDQKKEEAQHKMIEFYSDNKSDKFCVENSYILFIRSSDNYVEVHYSDGSQTLKRLLRNTLRNVELILLSHPNFMRCHRICIVNIHKIKRLNGNCSNGSLSMEDSDENLPVSRQYYLSLKERLSFLSLA